MTRVHAVEAIPTPAMILSSRDLRLSTATGCKKWRVLPNFRQAEQLVLSVGSMRMMKRVIDTSETLGVVQTPEGPRELCVSADAQYDEEAGRLVVKLEAFLRNTDLVSKEKHFTADWLPGPETVRESVGPDETVEMAREVFHRWVRKVRDAAPALHHN